MEAEEENRRVVENKFRKILLDGRWMMICINGTAKVDKKRY